MGQTESKRDRERVVTRCAVVTGSSPMGAYAHSGYNVRRRVRNMKRRLPSQDRLPSSDGRRSSEENLKKEDYRTYGTMANGICRHDVTIEEEDEVGDDGGIHFVATSRVGLESNVEESSLRNVGDDVVDNFVTHDALLLRCDKESSVDDGSLCGTEVKVDDDKLRETASGPVETGRKDDDESLCKSTSGSVRGDCRLQDDVEEQSFHRSSVPIQGHFTDEEVSEILQSDGHGRSGGESSSDPIPGAYRLQKGIEEISSVDESIKESYGSSVLIHGRFTVEEVSEILQNDGCRRSDGESVSRPVREAPRLQDDIKEQILHLNRGLFSDDDSINKSYGSFVPIDGHLTGEEVSVILQNDSRRSSDDESNSGAVPSDLRLQEYVKERSLYRKGRSLIEGESIKSCPSSVPIVDGHFTDEETSAIQKNDGRRRSDVECSSGRPSDDSQLNEDVEEQSLQLNREILRSDDENSSVGAATLDEDSVAIGNSVVGEIPSGVNQCEVFSVDLNLDSDENTNYLSIAEDSSGDVGIDFVQVETEASICGVQRQLDDDDSWVVHSNHHPLDVASKEMTSEFRRQSFETIEDTGSSGRERCSSDFGEESRLSWNDRGVDENVVSDDSFIVGVDDLSDYMSAEEFQPEMCNVEDQNGDEIRDICESKFRSNSVVNLRDESEDCAQYCVDVYEIDGKDATVGRHLHRDSDVYGVKVSPDVYFVFDDILNLIPKSPNSDNFFDTSSSDVIQIETSDVSECEEFGRESDSIDDDVFLTTDVDGLSSIYGSDSFELSWDHSNDLLSACEFRDSDNTVAVACEFRDSDKNVAVASRLCDSWYDWSLGSDESLTIPEIFIHIFKIVHVVVYGLSDYQKHLIRYKMDVTFQNDLFMPTMDVKYEKFVCNT